MTSFDDVLAAATRREERVELCVAGHLNAQFEALESRLRDVNNAWVATSLDSVNAEAVEIVAQMDEVQAAMIAATFSFRLRAVGGKQWSDLLTAHPSQDPDRLFDVGTFAPALIAACAVEPEMTPDQVCDLFEILNQRQRDQVFNAAWSVNNAADIPFSSAASAHRPS